MPIAQDPTRIEASGDAAVLLRLTNQAIDEKHWRDAGWKKYESLAKECWASSSYPNVKRWLADRR